ncbi:MAG: helix-turn-helix transcriptional regulator [Oscillatoriophycideae cyanobacterium NC_groundwater_1537_Pr4_S-0.65um_50_18]|nr:helix-turn-helix transcriptional regulator [Oscillatoriophycideae cyanobacterium NC_groundwater_1537_Pr4_S-0.65um_50_18]
MLSPLTPPERNLPDSTESLILSSHGFDWRGVHLECHHKPKGEENRLSLDRLHLICIETTQRPCDAHKWMDGRFQSRPIIQGDIFVLPEKIQFRERFEGAIDYILLYLEADWVATVAQEAVDPDRIEILPYFPQPDPFLYHSGLQLKSAIEAKGSFNQLYAETLAVAIAVHLLQHYAGKRTRRNLATLTAVSPHARLEEVTEYMQCYCDRNLSLSELADLAQMSLHYFARSFKQQVGLSPHQYLIRARIERAKQLLLQNNLTVAEVAHRVGFADQSHLCRHFKQATGLSPKQWHP